ncbi:MAG: sulfotransferase family protein [Cyclobacteriaceae bacterium]
MKPRIISLWSGPRNVSTALMYSFAQRADTAVVDEPLYSHYLIETGADHPGRDEVIRSMPSDPAEIWRNLKTFDKPVLFVKNMAHHAIALNDEWYSSADPILLIRDPEEMLPSLRKQIPEPVLRDTGLAGQRELLYRFLEAGRKPAVIDSGQLLRDPPSVLEKLCKAIELPFDQSMLSWQKGPRKEDGVWAKYWYHRIHESTGFEPYSPKKAAFPEELKPLLDICEPIYNELLTYA